MEATRLQLDRWTSLLTPHAWWLLALYLVLPALFKAALQPLIPVDLTLALAIPTAFVGVACVWRLKFFSQPAFFLWGALTLLVAVGVLYAPDRSIALDWAARWALLGALPLLAAVGVVRNRDQLFKFLVALAVVGGFVTIAGMVAIPAIEAGELELFDTNRLGVARAVLLVPLIALPLAWRSNVWVMAVIPLCAAAIFVAVATGSRAAVLGFVAVAVATGVVALVRSRAKKRLLAVLGGAVLSTLLLFLALGWLLPDHALARFGLLTEVVAQPSAEPSLPAPSRDVDGAREDVPRDVAGDASSPPSVGGDSVAVRAQLGVLALEEFADHPLIGSGTGGFQVAASRAGLGLYPHPHNLVLQFASDFGLVGLGLLGALALFAALRARNLTSHVGAALAATFSFLVVNAMFSNGIYDNRMLWGVWLGIMALSLTGRGPSLPTCAARRRGPAQAEHTP